MANIFPKLVQMTDELPGHRDIVRLSVLFRAGPGLSGSDQMRTRDPGHRGMRGPGELNTESCPASEKYRDFEKNMYFVCKMKISVDCSQMSDPPGFVDASREKLPRTFDIFTVCNSGVCKRRQKPVGDVRKPQT